ncbi:hypothetical protein [Streptomyces sp. NBC_01589]|uniref:hypothetical protein n=1 Tax=unclassified Streptomyces TaxID=2593676 RepID=UPI003868A95F
MRGGGGTVRLWAPGGSQLSGDVAPLPLGHRRHTVVHIGRFEADKDPAVVLYNAISNRLLPAFDTKPLYVGHRPWDPAPELEAAATADAEATTIAAGGTDQPVPGAAPEPEPQAPAEPPPSRPASRASPHPPQRPLPSPSRRRPGPKPAAKRTRRTKPATPAADGEPKPRPARKSTPAKPATS